MAMYDYNKRNWEDEVTSAQARKRAAEEAVNGYGSFSYGRQADYDAARDAVLNRGPFKYDLNKDALYKQVAENYKNLGKIAMQDTIGQASAMTGGYGNSYAQTAGQQAYQQFMQKSNEMIPQFYQMARENYDAEGNDLRAKLGILADDRNTAYGEWRDKYGQLVSERDYAGNEYNNIYNAALEAAKLQLARSSGGSSGGSGKNGYTTLKPAMYDEALKGFLQDGNKGLEQWAKKYNLSDEDIDAVFDWVYDSAEDKVKNPNSPAGVALIYRDK